MGATGRRPAVHCLTNPVTTQDTANILLAAGGSAIMAQEPAEAAEITAICQATLLNTGVPDREKFEACILAGKRAMELGHPIVLDPVGAGASNFRREELAKLLSQLQVSIIRCNQEEARVLLGLRNITSGGVESSVVLPAAEQETLARNLAQAYRCVTLVSGNTDAISDGEHVVLLTEGDSRISRLTGGGCMLSALCALLCAEGLPAFDAAQTAGLLWRESAAEAGRRTDREQGGMGTFHQYLFDAAEKAFSSRVKNFAL
ncbi:MAG: hydroxyethylthiazole kinase [Lachnospiraceae bacterium]|nr:hydroxyethylthiazole kinase [Lachnospiraceae bacterium]